MELTTATPEQVDTELAEIYSRYYVALDKQAMLHRRLADCLRQMEPSYAYYRSADVPRLQKRRLDLEAEIEAAGNSVAAILAESAPFEAEYKRRGGWTRAWLVDNAGGHIHSSQACSTCYPTTRFLWLPQVSGWPEEAIVAEAGKGACTVCYPTAPAEVLSQPRRLDTPERIAARAEREAQRLQREAERAAKAIHNPDGTTLRDWSGFAIKTDRTAQSRVVDALEYLEADLPPHLRAEVELFVDRGIAALSTKRGIDGAGLRVELQKKAAAKIRRRR